MMEPFPARKDFEQAVQVLTEAEFTCEALRTVVLNAVDRYMLDEICDKDNHFVIDDEGVYHECVYVRADYYDGMVLLVAFAKTKKGTLKKRVSLFKLDLEFDNVMSPDEYRSVKMEKLL